ncbi:MAG: hypothetical protein OES32_07875 [Acidobacteriota bacterium]|nr:hypothetical protein [Acidobacteriota bacterium]MDH3523491.1 hypothetical protein [Acidobacteriota bacterium]
MGVAPPPEVPRSLTDVCEVEVAAARGARGGAPPEVLIEVPHGATRRRHFAAARRRLAGELPADLEEFFFVNTDVGSIECARWVARMATGPERFPELEGLPGAPGGRALERVLILRGLVPRTFIDCNRVIAGGPRSAPAAGLTPGLPAYIRREEDVRTLRGMYGDYQAAAEQAYAAVCGGGGRAVILHTYAPRSVRIEAVDEGIVAALRRAYEPATYETWERRPAVDLITETADGRRLAPEALAREIRERYGRIGVEAAENATYRLDEATLGHVHSARYPGRVLCLEINRELLADPFLPFVEMSISEVKARRMAAPIAAALLSVGRDLAS